MNKVPSMTWKKVRPGAVLAVLAPTLILACFGFMLWWSSNHISLRNFSGQPITDITLELRDSGNPAQVLAIKRMERLNVGESLSLRHWENDFYAVVEFSMAGRKIRQDHREPVDLWAGESWALYFQTDGSLKPGHSGRHPDGD